jgi:hypothetical protein
VYLSEAQEQKYGRVCICLRHSDKSTEEYVSVSGTVTKVRKRMYLFEAQEQKYRRVCICLRHRYKSTEGYVSV